MIDFHVHIDGYAWQELELASLCGIDALITAAYHPHKVKITTNKIIDTIEKVQFYDSWRASMHSIKLYAGIGINPMSVPVDYDVFLDKLPELLSKEHVVAIGEVGLDPRSETCSDMDIQIHIFKRELETAKELDKPVFVHIPPPTVKGVLEKDWKSHKNTKEIVEKDIELIKETKIDPNQVLIDHLDENLVEFVLDQGLNAGITVQPWRNVTPNQTAQIIKKFEDKYTRLFISSDYSDTLESDCVAVPKTAKRMRAIGVDEKVINNIVYENPKRLFKLK
jgi:predicted metal-dependent TIM-barrel fold hydrolase